jgi:predicted phage terminase large subunit-like protein
MMEGLDPRRAAEIVLRRRRIQGDLVEWCREIGMEPSRHHRLIIQALERVAQKQLRRVAIFAPPGSAKSSYVSVAFPPYYLARHKKASIIAASHTAELGEHWGRRVRNTIAEHRATLDIDINPDVKAAARWETTLLGETTTSGEYFAAGVGGAIAGRRADLALIDDPVRNREDADSPSVQRQHFAWWKNDLLPRLKPDASVVLIQTRWHEADLAGQILADEKDDWEVIELPMEAGPGDILGRKVGERLWPEWFNEGMVRDAKKDQRVWTSLYQQRPTSAEGYFFKREWLVEVKDTPPRESLNVYGASDYAVSKNQGDYTVHLVVGLDCEEKMYVLDLWRDQAEPEEWVEVFCDLVQEWRPLAWAEERGHIEAGIGPHLKRRQRERGAYVFKRSFPSRYDKAIRAQSIRSRMAVEKLYIPSFAPWKADLMAELLAFPAGKHDDMVDALSLIGQMLDRIRGSDMPADPTEQRTRSGYSPVPRYDRKPPLRAIDI